MTISRYGTPCSCIIPRFFIIIYVTIIPVFFRKNTGNAFMLISRQNNNKLPTERKHLLLRMDTTAAAYEVEQKFVISDDAAPSIDNQLEKLGMKLSKKKVMVDWYFDTEPPILSLRDVWLRYRSNNQGEGQWELKRGDDGDNTPGGGTTVYQEIEGDEAVKVCLKILSSMNDNDKSDKMPSSKSLSTTATTASEFDGYIIPDFPIVEEKYHCYLQRLVPFSRIETQRSSWVDSNEESSSSSLAVDLDVSNFGYSVGEVEYLVKEKEDVQSAKEKINQFLIKLLPDFDPTSQERSPLSKLEHYLLKFRPDHLQLLNPGEDISKLSER